MPQIRLEKVGFGYAETLFENVTLSINDGDRIGIVGNNGSGKSTLLKCIAGVIEPQSGRVHRPSGLKFGFIEQDIPKNLHHLNLFDVISEALPPAEKQNWLWKVDVTLDIFQAPDSLRHKPVQALSGGWQRLALIARVALSQPDILLLDEPTNHLDISKIMVLEQWLNEQMVDIPLVTISHDRRFLDHCTNKTFFLRGTSLTEYRGSYTQAKQLLSDDDHSLSLKRANELKEMNRLKRSAHMLRQIGVNNYSDSALKKSVQIAKRAEGIESQLTKIHVEEKRNINLSNSGIQTKRLIGLKDIDICAPDGAFLFRIEQLDIMQGDRLIIYGANGSGKTQLLTCLKNALNDLDLARANGVSVAPTAKLGYIDQHLSHLPLGRTLRDHFDHEFPFDHQKTTGILINAGFSMVLQRAKLSELSHGQRARVAFLMLHLMQPNLYIMDEPTNHLDIAGQEQLESEILEQGATTVVVSHDRVFAQNIGTKFYAIRKNRLVSIPSPETFYQAMQAI